MFAGLISGSQEESILSLVAGLVVGPDLPVQVLDATKRAGQVRVAIAGAGV